MDRRTAVENPLIEIVTDEAGDDWLDHEPSIDWRTYLHQDPAILVGKPVIRGTRISAEFILELFAAGWSEDLVLENYSHLSRESIRAVFELARECVRTTYPVRRDW